MDSLAKHEGSRCLAARIVSSVLICIGPITANAVVRADVVSEFPGVPTAAPPMPPLKLATSLAAIGGKAPPPRDSLSPPELRTAYDLSRLLGGSGTSAVADVPRQAQAQAEPTRVPPKLLAAATATGVARDFDDDDEVGGDEPTGPAMVLGEMPGRRPPPMSGRDSFATGAPRGAVDVSPVPGIPGMGGLPCVPGLPCMPVWPIGRTPAPNARNAGAEEGGFFGDSATTGVAMPTTSESGAPGPGDGLGLGWGLAPIRWGGNVGVQMRRQQASAGSSWTDAMGTFNLRGASYLYAPWLAQVSGNIGLTTGQRNANSSDSNSNSSDNNNSIVGGATLQLFPVSRFPFMATFDRSDSRTNGTFVNQDYTNTRFNLRQTYRTESGAQNGTIGYDRSVVETMQNGKDVVNALYGDYSHAFENQTTQMNGRYSQTDRDYNGESSKLINYYARHTYRFEENLNLETSTMLNDNTLRYRVNNSLNDSHGRYLQMNASASWRPEYEDDLPLSVTGGVGVLSSVSDYNGDSSEAKSMSGNLSATYNYSPNLTLMGSGLVTRLNTNGGNGQLLTNVGGAATYVGDPLEYEKFSYNWNVGSSANRQTGTSGGDNLIGMLQASHSLGRDIQLSERQGVNLSLSQGMSHSSDQIIGSSSTLNHSAGGTWRVNGSDQTYGSVGLSVSDMLTTGANEGHYQYVYLQLNGNGQMSPRSSFSANLTVQWSMQDNKTLVVNSSPFATTAYFTDQTKRTNIFGSATYSHSRAFNIPGLRYTFSFNANTQMSDARLYGDASANPERYTYWFDNRFDFRIGKLDLSATGTIMEVGGKKNAQVFFRATREFGKF